MQKILNKRILRDLRGNGLRYLALYLLILMGMYLVISIVGASESIITSVKDAGVRNHVEDGEFTVLVPLEEANIEELKSLGFTVEEAFYLDVTREDDSILRIYKNREYINLIDIEKGKLAGGKNEIVLEKHYAASHNITVDSVINISGKGYLVTGIGSVPDYDAPFKNISDASVQSDIFGVGFVTREAYEELQKEGASSRSEEYVYTFLQNNNNTAKELKDYLEETTLDLSKITDPYFLEMFQQAGKNKVVEQNTQTKQNSQIEQKDQVQEKVEVTGTKIKDTSSTDLNNLTQFIEQKDNPRIAASSDDVLINKQVGIFAGIIILGLFTYVISVFVIHGIEQESSVIGSLYALGVTKKQLIRHYLKLPIVITFVGGFMGTLLGFSSYGVDTQVTDAINYFSLPEIKTAYPLYLILYGIIMPPIVAVVINYIVINKKLSESALKLIRNEQKKNKISNVNLRNLKFVSRFQIRQFLRELRSSLTVVVGMFISLLILMLGANCYTICINLSVQNKEDTNFNYMYSLKYPTENVPEGGEAGYAVSLKKEALGYNLDVTLLGIDDDNPYFDIQVAKGRNKVTISEAVATKFNISESDTIVLEDEVNEMYYAFMVEEIVPYSVGLYVFMDIDSMRELFRQEEGHYNVVFSKNALTIDSERLYATTTKEDIGKSADVFMDNMWSLIITMFVASAAIFITVMYLMMKVMIDRSSFSISLMKIFGFKEKEIRKLYLDGNFIMIAVSAAACIPLSKLAMDTIYPYFVANVACGVDLTFTWKMYGGIYAAVILCYFIINKLLVKRLQKMVPADILKARE